ncbi:MAG: aspartate kinase, partial [Lysobacterales bacterium]
MLVQKFGGSSLADLDSFISAAAIVAAAGRQEKTVVVLSAMYGITDMLQAAISAAIEGGEYQGELDNIRGHEQTVLARARDAGFDCPQAESFAEKRQPRLTSLLEGIALLKQCPNDVHAEIMSYGEGFSSRLMTDILRAQGHAARWSDTDILPPANDSYTDSLVDIEAAAPLLQQALSGEDDILVLPGFYGVNRDGKPQLMGRNGSDYSATSVATALKARSCEIWKDVDGFFTADPKVVASARCLDEVSYEEAMELSFFGAKVISAKALTPL